MAVASKPDRLHHDLLRWFGREKRDLPWRANRDPYRIWISEAMLQQTRVETVVPYFHRFLSRFPTVEALARAREASVLAAWSGLGYYHRARSLRAAARAIVERHGGRFPDHRDALLELPGIGPYTAGAIASIAFGRPEPLVDGNVVRVLARLFGLEKDPASSAGRQELWSLARELVPSRQPGIWNQALMELGALVCTPKDPRCERCPVASRCVARRDDRIADLPRRKPRPAPLPVEIVVLAARRGERWLLERRRETGIMARMWQLPTFEVPGPGAPRETRLFPARIPPGLRAGETVCEFSHTITRHRIRATLKSAAFTARVPRPPLAWVATDRLAGSALTGMTRKCLSAILARRGRTRSKPKPARG